MAKFAEDLPGYNHLAVPEVIDRQFSTEGDKFIETWVFPTGDVAQIPGTMIDGEPAFRLDDILSWADNSKSEIRHFDQLFNDESI